jgi:membrane fusion protein, multidrug efflux system
MKRIILIASVIIVFVGACTATLLYNKKMIDAKSKLAVNIKNIPVFVMDVKKMKMEEEVSASGSFSAIHELNVMSETQGRVVALYFNSGDFVQKGQLLVQLDDELIRSKLSLAQATYEKAKSDFQKYEGLLKSGAISSQQFEESRIALKMAETEVTGYKKQQEYACIKAPIQGNIVKRPVEIGSIIMPGTVMAEIVDISNLKFLANVSEDEAVKINKGMKVSITSTMFPGTEYKGTVQSVSVKADDARRFTVEVELMNDPKHLLRAGMYGTTVFGFGNAHDVLCIPRHSIVGSIRTPRVYVVEGAVAVVKDIRIGRSTDGQVEVLEGLKEGDLVVTSGQINLDNNTPVAIVNNKKI